MSRSLHLCGFHHASSGEVEGIEAVSISVVTTVRVMVIGFQVDIAKLMVSLWMQVRVAPVVELEPT